MTKFNLIIFTDDEATIKLCKHYWLINEDAKFESNVKLLARKAELSQKQFLELINDVCDAQSTEIFCQDCEIPFIFKSRNHFLEKQRSLNWYLKNWICEDCSIIRSEREKQNESEALETYRQLIMKRYSSESYEILLEDLSLKDAVYLLSFIRFSANEDLSYAQPLSSLNFHEKLSPQKNFDYDIIRHLYREELIKPHPNSPVDAFSGEEADTFYLDKVFWILPKIPNSDHPKYLVMQLEEIFRLNTFPREWSEENLLIWKNIAISECLQYLENSLMEHNLELNPGEKTLLVLNNLLEEFSVGQIFNMIWRSAKDAAAFLVRKGVTRQHAANTVVGAIQRYGENARNNGWDVKAYRRPFNCPQSMISQVFFDSVLKLGENGFYRIPYNIGFEDIADIKEIDEIQ